MINLEPHSAHERACHMHGKLKTSKEIWRHTHEDYDGKFGTRNDRWLVIFLVKIIVL